MLKWVRMVERMAGGLEGRGGISWAARFGAREVVSAGERGAGGWTWRYHGI